MEEHAQLARPGTKLFPEGDVHDLRGGLTSRGRIAWNSKRRMFVLLRLQHVAVDMLHVPRDRPPSLYRLGAKLQVAQAFQCVFDDAEAALEVFRFLTLRQPTVRRPDAAEQCPRPDSDTPAAKRARLCILDLSPQPAAEARMDSDSEEDVFGFGGSLDETVDVETDAEMPNLHVQPAVETSDMPQFAEADQLGVRREPAPGGDERPAKLARREAHLRGDTDELGLARAKMAASYGPNWGQLIAPSHRLSLAGTLVFCRTCGFFSPGKQHLRKLREPCVGEPAEGTTQARRRGLLHQGQHPVTGALLPRPVPIINV